MFKISKDIAAAIRQEFCSPEQVEYPKVHFTSASDISKEVCNDLDKRFGPPMTIEQLPDQNECSWDPGGMMFVDDEEFSFDLETITVKCLAQHFLSFEAQVNKRAGQPIRGNDIQYVKLHGAYACICLTLKEFELLLHLVSSEDKENNYHERANKASEDFMNRLSRVKDHLKNNYEAESPINYGDIHDKNKLN